MLLYKNELKNFRNATQNQVIQNGLTQKGVTTKA